MLPQTFAPSDTLNTEVFLARAPVTNGKQKQRGLPHSASHQVSCSTASLAPSLVNPGCMIKACQKSPALHRTPLPPLHCSQAPHKDPCLSALISSKSVRPSSSVQCIRSTTLRLSQVPHLSCLKGLALVMCAHQKNSAAHSEHQYSTSTHSCCCTEYLLDSNTTRHFQSDPRIYVATDPAQMEDNKGLGTQLLLNRSPMSGCLWLNLSLLTSALQTALAFADAHAAVLKSAETP